MDEHRSDDRSSCKRERQSPEPGRGEQPRRDALVGRNADDPDGRAEQEQVVRAPESELADGEIVIALATGHVFGRRHAQQKHRDAAPRPGHDHADTDPSHRDDAELLEQGRLHRLEVRLYQSTTVSPAERTGSVPFSQLSPGAR